MTVLQKFKQPVEVWGFQVRLGGNLGVVNHANTADRIYTFPDVAGNVLLDNSFLGHALPALSAGYLNWNGTTWALSAVAGSSVGINATGIWYDVVNLAYETTLSYSLTSPARTFTITPTGASFRVYVNGVLFTLTGAQTVQHAATQGLWYIYYDNTGTLQASQTAWNILDTAPIALIYYDASIPDYWLFDERHHYTSSVEWHESQHFAIGAYVKHSSSDFGISGYTLGTATDAGVQWALAAGTIVDEDINILTNVIAAAGPYQIMAKIGAGGNFVRTQATVPFLYDAGSKYVEYNQFTGGAWQLTPLASSRRVNYYVFATTGAESTKQIMIIPGQAFYSALADAQAELVSSLDLTQFPGVEFAPLYQVTLHTLAGNGNNGKCSIEAITKITATHAGLNASTAALTNPMTAADDMIIGGASGAPNRLPIGTAGQVLTIVGGVPTWSNTGLAPTAFTVASAIPVLTFTRSDLTASVTFTQTTATNVTLSCDFTATKFNGSGAGLTLGTVTDSYTIQSLGTVTTAQSPTIANGRYIKMTLGANITVNLPNGTNSNTTEKLIFAISQDATGSRTILWQGQRGFAYSMSPVLTINPGATDILEFTWDGNYWMMTNFTPNGIGVITTLQGLRPSTSALTGSVLNYNTGGTGEYDTGTTASVDSSTFRQTGIVAGNSSTLTYSGFTGTPKSGTLSVNIAPFSVNNASKGSITVSYSKDGGSTWNVMQTFTDAGTGAPGSNPSLTKTLLTATLYNQNPTLIQVKVDYSIVAGAGYACTANIYDIVFI